MKAIIIIILSLFLLECSGNSLQLSARQILAFRLQKYIYFSTQKIENLLKSVNKTDPYSLNSYIEFDLDHVEDPFSVNWYSGDQICISNTFFAFLFTSITFSASCYIVVAFQLMNLI